MNSYESFKEVLKRQQQSTLAFILLQLTVSSSIQTKINYFSKTWSFNELSPTGKMLIIHNLATEHCLKRSDSSHLI